MSNHTYSQQHESEIAETAERLATALFALTNAIRYAAIYDGTRPYLFERAGIADASAAESDMYEELLVNPTLLFLARQRGDIDCGGLEYVIVRYGKFFQLVVPLREGHVSVAFEPAENPVEWFPRVMAEVGRATTRSRRCHGT